MSSVLDMLSFKRNNLKYLTLRRKVRVSCQLESILTFFHTNRIVASYDCGSTFPSPLELSHMTKFPQL